MWYFLKNSRPVGPVSEKEIRDRISTGELGPHDLVYHENDSKWMPLLRVLPFARHLGVTEQDLDQDEDSWVLLIKKKNVKTRVQSGPHKTSEVKAMIRHGQVTLSDYVWKEGMKEWYKILAIESLHKEKPVDPRFESIKLNKINESSKELFKEVQPMERKKTPSSVKPSEAEGPDLVKEKFKKSESEVFSDEKTKAEERFLKYSLASPSKAQKSPKTSSKSTKKKFSIQEPPGQEPSITKTETNIHKELFKTKSIKASPLASLLPSYADIRPWLAPALGFTLGVGLFVFGVLLIVSKQKPPILENIETLTESLLQSPGEEGGKDAPSPESAAEVTNEALAEESDPVVSAEPRREASFLRLSVRGPGTQSPQVIVNTDASSHFGVSATLESLPGRVIGGRSYFRSWTIRGLEDRRVDLSEISLSPGFYRFTADIGGHTREASVNVGTGAAGFDSQLNQHRKQISVYAQEERVVLFKTIEQKESLIQELEGFVMSGRGVWAGFYRSWRQNFARANPAILRNINNRNRQNYVLANHWLELKALRSQMDRVSGELNRQGGQINASLRSELTQTKSSLRNLKSEVLDFSLFR